MKKKLHLAGAFSALTSLAGIIASPAVLGILPPKWAAGVAIAGVVLQSVTKPVQAGGTDLVPKAAP